MAHIRYDIVRTPRGWRIVCDGVVSGVPYLRRQVALRDAASAAEYSAKSARTLKSLQGEPVKIDPREGLPAAAAGRAGFPQSRRPR
jgi:hypothetical protein